MSLNLNNKSILIELEDEGWKFSCDNFNINIDNGLYLGIKNSYKENQNIFVSGISNKSDDFRLLNILTDFIIFSDLVTIIISTVPV